MMRKSIAAFAALAVLGCSEPQQTTKPAVKAPPPITPIAVAAPAGAYKLDPQHASLIFKIDHLGISNYTARFTGLEGDLQFDPRNPQASSIVARVDPASLETDYPDPKFDFDRELEGSSWLAAAQFPQITFRSTRVTLTGPQEADVAGELTFHGVTRPIVLHARFNGGYAPNGMDPMGSRIGFSATGSLNRSEFGMKTGLPAPGSKMGVSDAVQVIIEAEFTQPAAQTKVPAG